VKWLLGIVGCTGFVSVKYGFAVLAKPKGIGDTIMIFPCALFTLVL